jgi:hypothetical protein
VIAIEPNGQVKDDQIRWVLTDDDKPGVKKKSGRYKSWGCNKYQAAAGMDLQEENVSGRRMDD